MELANQRRAAEQNARTEGRREASAIGRLEWQRWEARAWPSITLKGKYNNTVDRLNSEGNPRDQLKLALSNRMLVEKNRKLDRCLLCCSSNVNEAALCHVCWSFLDDAEYEIARRWTIGVGP